MPENKKMGRPIVGEPKDIPVQLRFDKSTLEKLDRLAKQKKMSRSEYVRWLINEMI